MVVEQSGEPAEKTSLLNLICTKVSVLDTNLKVVAGKIVKSFVEDFQEVC